MFLFFLCNSTLLSEIQKSSARKFLSLLVHPFLPLLPRSSSSLHLLLLLSSFFSFFSLCLLSHFIFSLIHGLFLFIRTHFSKCSLDINVLYIKTRLWYRQFASDTRESCSSQGRFRSTVREKVCNISAELFCAFERTVKLCKVLLLK